jgi:hypothetical protein
MPHAEGSFDTLQQANARKKELAKAGYSSRIVVTKYGPHTPPLYRVFRQDSPNTPYPPIKRYR